MSDNPFSEAQFKTLKYRPGFPDRFCCFPKPDVGRSIGPRSRPFLQDVPERLHPPAVPTRAYRPAIVSGSWPGRGCPSCSVPWMCCVVPCDADPIMDLSPGGRGPGCCQPFKQTRRRPHWIRRNSNRRRDKTIPERKVMPPTFGWEPAVRHAAGTALVSDSRRNRQT